MWHNRNLGRGPVFLCIHSPANENLLSAYWLIGRELAGEGHSDESALRFISHMQLMTLEEERRDERKWHKWMHNHKLKKVMAGRCLDGMRANTTGNSSRGRKASQRRCTCLRSEGWVGVSLRERRKVGVGKIFQPREHWTQIFYSGR